MGDPVGQAGALFVVHRDAFLEGAAIQWFTVSRLSDHQELTPEGFLLVKDVPIARCGQQLYRDVELPDLIPNADGWISCDREPAEVFREDSIASFTGKPITNDHPMEVVTPDNWTDLAIGHIQHPRRGRGDAHDLLIADLLFTTKRGIDLVRRGKRALSVGYDAYYEQTSPGLARQRNIVANHVALVDEGRCGARCTIVDGSPWYNVDASDKEFNEEDHPRIKSGKGGGEFTKGGGGGGAISGARSKHVMAGKGAKGEHATPEGKALPEHVKKAGIPPAWKDVTYDPDPKAELIASGVDAKGRRQPIYSDAHHAKKGAEKFARVKAMAAQMDKIKAKNKEAQKSSDPKVRDAADAAALIMHTGMRPGSDADTGADTESYGATTLEGRHVIETKAGVKLRFVPGKKHGQTIEMPVTDPAVAKMLLKRKAAGGSKDRIFPNTSAGALGKHVKSLGGDAAKTKDIRTYIGTQTAIEAIKQTPEPMNEKQYKLAVKQVATIVSDKLGNTASIALASYISPVVFAGWQQAAHMMQKDAAPDDDMDELPDASWGEYGAELPPIEADDGPDDDGEDITEADEDVIAMLGFDPFDLDDGPREAELLEEGDDEDAGDRTDDDWHTDIDYVEDDWEESKHPRVAKGSAGGGQFGKGGGGEVGGANRERLAGQREAAAAEREQIATRKVAPEHIKNIPEPNKNGGQPGRLMQGIVQKGLENGTDPKDLAATIKGVVARYAHALHERYGNQMLAHIEKAYGLKPGELGKAVRKSGVAPPIPAAKPAKPAPKPATPAAKPPPPPEPKTGKTPTSFKEVKALRTDWNRDEANYHSSAWYYATPELLGAMAKVYPLNSVRPINGTSNYRSGDHRIRMRQGADPSVWRHEYGHAIDFNGGNPSSMGAEHHRKNEADALIKLVTAARINQQRGRNDTPHPEPEEIAQAAKAAGVKSDDILEFAGGHVSMASEIVQTLNGNPVGVDKAHRRRGYYDAPEAIMFADFLGSMTKNAVSRGHEDSYYAQAPYRMCGEMFANYVSLTNGPGGKIYNAMMHAVAPKCCKHFDDILKDRANGP